jgi:hypothetical protein
LRRLILDINRPEGLTRKSAKGKEEEEEEEEEEETNATTDSGGY